MFATRLARQFMIPKTRQFNSTSILYENTPSTSNEKKPDANAKPVDPEKVIGSRMYTVTDFDKRMLVWVKRYPSIADVPRKVSVDCILQARSRARIRTCNIMIAVTIVGCILAVMAGKRDRQKMHSKHAELER